MMSDERFDRIEKRLDDVASDVGVLKSDVGVLKSDVAVLKSDVAVLKSDVAVLKSDVAVLKTDVGGLKADGGTLRAAVAANKAAIEELRRHMGVLHEDTIERIRALGEDDSLRREMQAGFAELRQMLRDHASVGDAADRRFAATLDDHERRIRTLEDR